MNSIFRSVDLPSSHIPMTFSALRLCALLLGFSVSSASAQDITAIDSHSGREVDHLISAPQSLENRGITPYATYLGEIFTNHSGGISNGSAWAGLLDVGVELDLEKLVGWKGASFFANAFYFQGNDVSGNRVGDFNAVSNLYTDTSFNFYNIFLQQAFGEGDSFFKIGQIALDDNFMVSEPALLFLNAGFGPLPVQSGNTAAPIYALAAPGALINIEPDSPYFFRAGIYTGDAGPANSSNRGFDWRIGGSAGWMLMAEGGIKYGKNQASNFKVGGGYHTGDFERFSDGATESGLYFLYAVLDHQIISPDIGTSLDFFLRAGIAPQDEISAVTAYAEGGLVARSVFLEDDALGMATSWTNFSDDFVLSEGGETSEIVIELTYQAPVTDKIVIQPTLQYIIDPQGSGEDAFLTGLRAEFSF